MILSTRIKSYRGEPSTVQRRRASSSSRNPSSAPVREFITLKLPSAFATTLKYAPSAPPLRFAISGFGAVVRRIRVFRRVQHLQVLEPRALMHRLPCLGTARLVRAVVHDGNARMNRIHKGLGVRQIEAVMIHEIKIDVPDQVAGHTSANLLRLGQIAQVEKAELAEPSPARRVDRGFSVGSSIPLRLARAIRIRPSASRPAPS